MPYGPLTISFHQTRNEAYEDDGGRTWRMVEYESDSEPKIVIRYQGYDDEGGWTSRSVVSHAGYMLLGDMVEVRPCPMVCDTFGHG